MATDYTINYFGEHLKCASNIVYWAVYAAIFAYYSGMIINSQYWFFNVTFFIGYGLGFIGFLGRVLAVGNEHRLGYCIMQSFCLTVSPAFIMGGFFKPAKDSGVQRPLARPTVGNILKMLFNVPSAKAYKLNVLDESYNARYYKIRQSRLFGWFPLAITVAVVVVYIRCVYRVVELAQG
ncbi:hypothetical protein Cantr_04206 [Candida viswanathii]|uniref:Sphingoid long-chain base transporter RSB1 n=1 Tax=Candida viswanathii TaxID=5486 RepID=A0A367XNI4_9ASCO|nr:hypothetical protein Cantr_04206 [Candida viswanathii]